MKCRQGGKKSQGRLVGRVFRQLKAPALAGAFQLFDQLGVLCLTILLAMHGRAEKVINTFFGLKIRDEIGTGLRVG